jgi:phosphoribosylamine--glycine ligase
MRWLVVGGGAREHAIGRTLVQAGAEVVVASANANPGLDRLAVQFRRLAPTAGPALVAFAREARADAAVIGPEAALAAGVADALRAAEIPTVGPGKDGAQLETSKKYCREFLARHSVGAQPKYALPTTPAEVDQAIASIGGPFVVKPSGLTAGKGVWVQGSDFTDAREGAVYAKSLLVQSAGVVLEEKLDGEEFSLMAFVTGSGVYPMPAVQDFKRALEGNQGGNTGGMGAYTQRDHLLPFLGLAARDRALSVLEQAVAGLRKDGIDYRGILYGGFLLTADGPRLLEFNARFGDPEGVNVLTLYEEGDFSELLHGVAMGRVDPNLVRFRRRSTVLKYIVPPGYGGATQPGGIVTLDEEAIEDDGVHVFYGQVESRGPGAVELSSSRGIALIGEASAIAEASARVELALQHVHGEFYVRHDIGTHDDLVARTEHMRRLLLPGARPSPLPLSVAPPGAPVSSAAPEEQRA